MKAIIVSLLFVFLAWNVQAQSFEVLNPQVEQGGVIIVRITPQWLPPATFNPAISAFGNHYLPNKNGEVFIGVKVVTEPCKYNVVLVEYGRGVSLSRDIIEIEVLKKDFGQPWFRKLPKKSSKNDTQRKIEREIKDRAYNQANPSEFYVEGQFVYPLNNVEITDNFGTPRIYGTYNKKTKKWVPIQGIPPVPHTGTDLRAKINTPVRTINSGRVLLAHNFPIQGTEGKMIIIDHGSGILSLYLHLSKFMGKADNLSKFMVKDDNWVNKGDVIALSGATPKGTPPHLHFMIKVNGVNVDPLNFIDTINSVLGQ